MLMVYPGYFSTIGIPFASGRDFGDADVTETSPPVCIVNESYVRQVYPDQDLLGKPCYTGRREGAAKTTPRILRRNRRVSRSSASPRIRDTAILAAMSRRFST